MMIPPITPPMTGAAATELEVTAVSTCTVSKRVKIHDFPLHTSQLAVFVIIQLKILLNPSHWL